MRAMVFIFLFSGIFNRFERALEEKNHRGLRISIKLHFNPNFLANELPERHHPEPLGGVVPARVEIETELLRHGEVVLRELPAHEGVRADCGKLPNAAPASARTHSDFLRFLRAEAYGFEGLRKERA